MTAPSSAAQGLQAMMQLGKKSAPEKKNDSDAQATPGVFSQMLQRLEEAPIVQDAGTALSLLDVSGHSVDAEATLDVDAAMLLDTAILPPALQGLVGQTQWMDGQADRAVREGTLEAQGPLSPAWAGQPTTGLLTASLGVQAQDAHALTQMASSMQAGEVGQGMTKNAADDASAWDVASASAEGAAPEQTQGALRLDGAWRMLEQPSPVLQTVVGQVQQWAAQWFGGAGQGRSEWGQKQYADNGNAEAVGTTHAGATGGMRLLEQAVQAAAASADTSDAQQGSAQEQQAPVEDLRFWLQGQQQRAQLVLQRDGQPVRVQVLMQGDSAHVVLQSNEADTRAVLDGGLEQLRSMLEQQGLQLAGLQVQADSTSQGQSSYGGGRAGPQGSENVDDGGPARHAVVLPAPLPGDAVGAATAGAVGYGVGRLNVYA